MMRKCHLNTCPVGVATQDPVLRKRFKGQPEHVINYFFFVAEEVREMMAALGYRRFDEMIGQMQMLDRRKLVEHWKAKGLDFSRLFNKPEAKPGTNIFKCEPQDHKIHEILDRKLIAESQAALDRGAPVRLQTTIRNTDRAVGGMLSGEVAKRYGHAGLPDDTINVRLTGTAGQSFGAWLARGVTFELEGDANDYVGKGLSGGRIVIRPPADSGIVPEGFDHRRQHRALRRHRRRMLFPRRGGRTFRRAQFRRHRRDRRRRRPLLRIHDRRRGHRARQYRPKFRRRHVGWHCLCARRGRHLQIPLQHGDGRARASPGRRSIAEAGSATTTISKPMAAST